MSYFVTPISTILLYTGGSNNVVILLRTATWFKDEITNRTAAGRTDFFIVMQFQKNYDRLYNLFSCWLSFYNMLCSQNRMKIFPFSLPHHIYYTVWLSHLWLICFEAITFVCYVSCHCCARSFSCIGHRVSTMCTYIYTCIVWTMIISGVYGTQTLCVYNIYTVILYVTHVSSV